MSKSASEKKRKSKKRTLDDLTLAEATAALTPVSTPVFDETDDIVKAALIEDSKDAKTILFPTLLQQARAMIDNDYKPEIGKTVVINSLLNAFTKEDKTGRPLPRACQELMRRASDGVANARKRQRETRSTKKTSLTHSSGNSSMFVCTTKDCKKQYTTAEGLRLHIRNHHDVDKKWICHSPECTAERAFVRQADLRMHLIRMHSPVRPFPCRVPECTKTFACHSELRRHIAAEHIPLIESLLKEKQAAKF